MCKMYRMCEIYWSMNWFNAEYIEIWPFSWICDWHCDEWHGMSQAQFTTVLQLFAHQFSTARFFPCSNSIQQMDILPFISNDLHFWQHLMKMLLNRLLVWNWWNLHYSLRGAHAIYFNFSRLLKYNSMNQHEK